MTVSTDAWPVATDYAAALRTPETAFAHHPELAGASVLKGQPSYLPWAASGASAIVFSLTTASGQRVAVRCFTRRPQRNVDERYRALGSFLDEHPCPALANFDWTDDAIRIDSTTWPILQMEWIDGDPLKLFVAKRLEQRNEIGELSDTWIHTVAELEARRVAHGDLQHGNVIVSSSTDVRLVDLDEVYCAATRSFGTDEAGLASYQHPDRLRTRAWDQRIDRFSSIVIYVSLRALASARDPNELISEREALVLSADDLLAANQENTKAGSWARLFRSPDKQVQELTAALYAACRGPLEDVPTLEDVVRQVSAPSPPPTREETPLNPSWPPTDVDEPAAPLNRWEEPPPSAPESDTGGHISPDADGGDDDERSWRRFVLVGLLLIVIGVAGSILVGHPAVLVVAAVGVLPLVVGLVSERP